MKPQNRTAFTLVEALVCLAITSTLIAIALPVLGSSRDLTRRVACLAEMRDLGTVRASYANDNSDLWPSAMKYLESESVWGVEFRSNVFPATHQPPPMDYLGVANTWHAPLIDYAYGGVALSEAFFCPADEEGPEEAHDSIANQEYLPDELFYPTDRLASLALHLDPTLLREDGPLVNVSKMRTTRIHELRSPSAKAALYESTPRHTEQGYREGIKYAVEAEKSHSVLAADGSAMLRSITDATPPILFTNLSDGLWGPSISDAERRQIGAWSTTRDGVYGRDW